MSTFKNPVGRQSPQVYWRRRLAVGLGLLAVIVVVVLIIVRPGSAEPNVPATPPPTETATTEPVVEEGGECNPDTIAVKAVTDKGQYAAGEQPMISLAVVNNGAVACMMNVGTTKQVFEITSGSETYWLSTDCQTEPMDVDQLLEPGVELTTTPIPWDRTRSNPATCEDDRPAVPAGGATYHLTVSLGELTSEKTAPFLLN